MIRFARAIAVLILLCGSASAQAPAPSAPAQPFPFDVLATNDLTPTLPAHWKYNTISIQSVVLESIDMIPQDETTLFWRNKMVALALPTSAGLVDATILATNKARTCSASTTLNLRPRNAADADEWEEVICFEGALDPDGNPTAPFEVNVFHSTNVGDTTFVFFRVWRGPITEAASFFTRHSAATPVGPLPANPSSADFESLRPAMQRVVDDFAGDLSAAFPVCDLSGAACPALHQGSLPVGAFAAITVRGNGAGQAVNHDFPIASLDFANLQTARDIIHAIALAQAGGGGTITFSGAPRADAAPHVRAYLLRLGRIVMNNGAPPDSLSFNLWP